MIKYIHFICFISITNIAFTQEIDLNNKITSQPLPKFFTGASMADVLSGLNFELEDDNFNIKRGYFNEEYLQYCKELKISEYRFPAGTSGNYYHFYGKGSGLDSSEIFCNETYYGIPNEVKRNQIILTYNFEKRMNKNYAYYFVDFMKEMQKSIDNIGFYYHLNSHTHIYQGQLKNISQDLQILFKKYFNNNDALLNSRYDSLMNVVDTNQIKIAIGVMNNLKNDTAIIRIKNKLLNDVKFQYSFQENINSVRYFVSENIGIKGIEIGNETEAEYMLFDDDFSHYQYQCGVIDTNAINPFTKLMFKDFLEGIFKNWILATLYADTIHQLYNIPIGMTISGVRASAGFNANQEPYLINPYGAPEKKSFFWSKFFALEPKIDALIPHHYTQKMIDCEKYNEIINNIDVDEINQLVINYIKFHNDTVLPYILDNISKKSENKPLWITEWNFNMNSIVSNTFLHSYFLHDAIAKHITHFEQNKYNIQSWLLHYLSSSYFAFALIKANYNRNGIYEITKLLPYHAFYIWNQTLQKNVSKLNYTIESKINKESNSNFFVNNIDNEIYVHFKNISNYDDYYNFSNYTFIRNDSIFHIKKIASYILKSNKYLTTNFTDCNTLSSEISDTNYQIITDTTKKLDSLKLPPKSFGRFILHLENSINTNTLVSKKKCVLRKRLSKSKQSKYKY